LQTKNQISLVDQELAKGGLDFEVRMSIADTKEVDDKNTQLVLPFSNVNIQVKESEFEETKLEEDSGL